MGQSFDPANPALAEDEPFRFNRLRVRAEEAERQLRVVKADAAVLKSKQAAFVDRENFLLSEMRLEVITFFVSLPCTHLQCGFALSP